MVRKGFKMKLYPGMEAEYEKRHNELWPEMQDMIHEYGGKNYTIFLDRETLVLYGYIEVEDPAKWDESADTAINRKWWDFMADIMETNPDNRGVPSGLRKTGNDIKNEALHTRLHPAWSALLMRKPVKLIGSWSRKFITLLLQSFCFVENI